MIGSQDTWVLMPTVDLYDTLMMLAAINAAKDMYEKGQQDIKDFNKEYGDFISPFSKDMERYGEMVGGVKDAINLMYAAGIDPLRSAEGRAALSRLINSVNPAEFNMMRSNAKTGYAYLDAIQDLRRKGKYSEALELFDIMQTGGLGVDKEGNNIYDFANFSTAGRNGWNSFMRTSPIEAATLQELTKSGYEGRSARLLSEADFDDERLKGRYKYDPKYEWSGYLYSDLLKGAPGAIISASADPRMRFFRDLAEKKVASSGRPYTQADVEAQFQRDVADANTWALIDPTRKANEFALDDYRTANDINATWAKEAARSYYDILPYADENGDGKLSSEERKKYAASTIGGTKNRRVPNIFREAEALTQDLKGNPGQLVLYELPEQYHQYIDPVVQADQRILKDKNTGDTRIGYVYSSESIGKHGTMWVLGQDGKFHYTRIKSPSKGQYTFIPGGSMRSLYIGTDKNGNKLYRYFISGQFRTPSGNFVHNDDGTDTQWVEVKERAHNYGQTLKKQ